MQGELIPHMNGIMSCTKNYNNFLLYCGILFLHKYTINVITKLVVAIYWFHCNNYVNMYRGHGMHT